MPTARGLLRLYPAAWRARYGEEFLATVGDGGLRARDVFDILMVAIDAWLSPDVRDATRAYRPATNGGGISMLRSSVGCSPSNSRVTRRDGFIGAGVMIGATLFFSLLGIALRRSGWPVTGEILKDLAFPGSLAISMPFWLMKGQPWKAQGVIIGGTLFLLVVSAYIGTKI
jgi:hypothetical protein